MARCATDCKIIGNTLCCTSFDFNIPIPLQQAVRKMFHRAQWVARNETKPLQFFGLQPVRLNTVKKPKADCGISRGQLELLAMIHVPGSGSVFYERVEISLSEISWTEYIRVRIPTCHDGYQK